MISRKTLFAATAVTATAALLTAPALVSPALAQQSPAAPRVAYVPEGDRQLIFVNNPERLEVGYTDAVPGSVTNGVTFNDLADPTLGNKLISKITVQSGRYRNIYEHSWNVTRAAAPAAAQNPIHYGVFVSNPGREVISVTVYGKGFRTGFDGGRPIADALNEAAANPAGTTYTLEPGHLLWLQRTDVDYDGERAVLPGQFFSGMVDFDVSGGPAVVANLAYQDFGSLTKPESDDEAGGGDGNDGKGKDKKKPKEIINAKHVVAEDMGFIWRRYNATAPAESRVYKGLMVYPGQAASGSGVVTSVAVAINNAVAPNTNLTFSYPRYLNDSPGQLNRFSPSATTVTGQGWFTHNVPIRDTATIQVVANDMLDIVTPNYGTVFALFQSNAPNTIFGQANFGNWGVFYRQVVTVTNNGTRARTVALRVNNQTNGNSPIAYLDADGVWQSFIVRAAPFAYRTFTVPAGQTVTVEGVFTLGCPAVGTLKQNVTVTN